MVVLVNEALTRRRREPAAPPPTFEENPMTPALRSALALACTTLACMTYRDRIVVVTQLTQIERNTTTEAVPAEPAAPTPADTLTLSGAPQRLDAPTMRAALDGFGSWVEAPAYGVVWIPDERLRGPDFVPYLTAGQWIPTRVGWYWQSEYAWGAIPFHYGRWVRFNNVWAWVPGSAFAPAWVDWRVGNGWAAWAPLAPEGADFAAAHMYCAAARLRGAGLRARTVLGPAAAALFVYTAPVRVSCAQGASCYAPGPPVPTAVATDVASLWAASQTVAREVGATPARITVDPVGTPVEAPARIPDVPTVARVLNSATGTLRAADAPILHPTPASIAEGGPSSDVDPSDASDGTPRLAITSAQAPVATGRTLTSVTAGSSGYSVIPARRMTWSSSMPVAPAETAPRAVYAQRVDFPQRIEMPSAVYERSVATPPPLAAPSFAPSTNGWRAPSGYVAPTYGGGFPTGLPTTPYAVAGSTFGRPSFAPSYAPAIPSVVTASSAPVYAAPSMPVYAAPSMPSYAAPVISAAQAPVVPPSARGSSFGHMMGVPNFIAGGGGFRVR
jgi:hypothetical protein